MQCLDILNLNTTEIKKKNSGMIKKWPTTHLKLWIKYAVILPMKLLCIMNIK